MAGRKVRGSIQATRERLVLRFVATFVVVFLLSCTVGDEGDLSSMAVDNISIGMMERGEETSTLSVADEDGMIKHTFSFAGQARLEATGYKALALVSTQDGTESQSSVVDLASGVIVPLGPFRSAPPSVQSHWGTFRDIKFVEPDAAEVADSVVVNLNTLETYTLEGGGLSGRVSRDGSTIVYSTGDQKIAFIDTETGGRRVVEVSSAVSSISPDGSRFIAINEEDGFATVYERVEDGVAIVIELDVDEYGAVAGWVDNTTIVTRKTDTDNQVFSWHVDLRTGDKSRQKRLGLFLEVERPYPWAFNSEATIAKEIVMLNVDTGEEKTRRLRSWGGIFPVSVSSGRYIWGTEEGTGLDDGAVALWSADQETGEIEVLEFDFPPGGFPNRSLSAFALGNRVGMIVIGDVPIRFHIDGNLEVLSPYSWGVLCPDGRAVVAESNDDGLSEISLIAAESDEELTLLKPADDLICVG